jgi:predicted ATPase/DNA-binding XRE family transcriptional regulator
VAAVESENRGTFSEFGALLRRHRLAAGLSQDALAERARLSSAAISALERGERRRPQRDTFALLAGALALDAEQRREFEAAAARPRSVRRASVTVGPWPAAAESLLPLALSRFVGRETELAEITALVNEYRLVTLTGSGGVGKTQTALQVASAMRDANDAAICFVELAPLGDPSLVASAIAGALGVQEVPNHPLLETLIAYLKNRTRLLILDNCEHVVSDCASVAYKLLLCCPKLRILTTSREALRAAGERAYRLPSLSLSEAVELFTDRARAVDYHFALSEENRTVVTDLCRRLDGIPLAIEMAAARVQILTPHEILMMLEQQFRLLSSTDRSVPTRQQTMWTALEWSYQLLTQDEKAVLERLSVFSGGCTLEQAVAVCARDGQEQTEIRELLASLTNKSLVIPDFKGIAPRYRLLESARQYAWEKLDERGEMDAIAHRHLSACLRLAENLRDAYDSTPDREWFEPSRAELENWQRALDFSLGHRRDVVGGQRLVAALIYVWPALAPSQGRRWASLAQSLVDDGTPLDVRAGVSCAELKIGHTFDDLEQQLADANEALALCREVSDELGIALALAYLGRALAFLERLPEAESALGEALALGRRLRCRRLLAQILRSASYVCVIRGDFATARSRLAEARGIIDFNSDWEAAQTLDALSYCEYKARNMELAFRYMSEALPYVCPSYNPQWVARALNNLAEILIALGRYGHAEDRAREALDVANGMQAHITTAQALVNLARITALRTGDDPERMRKSYARFAQICGFVETCWLAGGSKSVSQLFREDSERTAARLREALGAEAFEKLTAEGASMTEEQAVELALASRYD